MIGQLENGEGLNMKKIIGILGIIFLMWAMPAMAEYEELLSKISAEHVNEGQTFVITQKTKTYDYYVSEEDKYNIWGVDQKEIYYFIIHQKIEIEKLQLSNGKQIIIIYDFGRQIQKPGTIIKEEMQEYFPEVYYNTYMVHEGTLSERYFFNEGAQEIRRQQEENFRKELKEKWKRLGISLP